MSRVVRGRLLLVGVGAGAAAWGDARDARAGYPDVFGWTPEVVAHAGAGVGDVDTMAAAFVNPAGHAFSARGMRGLSAAVVGSRLEARGERVRIADPWATYGGFVTRPRGGGWLARHLTVALGTHLVSGTVARVSTGYADAPAFPYYQNRTQRLVLLPSVALRLHETLAVGVSANFFAGLRGPADARDAAGREVEATVTQEVYARLAVIAGVRFAPSAQWSFGLAYRQRFSVPYAVATTVNVGGNALAVSVEAEGLYTPDEVVLGARFATARTRWLLDVAWARWSAWRGPFVQVRARLPGLDASPATPDAGLRDTVAVRLGGTVRLDYLRRRAVELRAGLGFETAMVGDQPGRTNLFDGERVVVGLGAGVELPRFWDLDVRLNLAGQLHHLVSRTYTKRVASPAEAARDPGALADEDAATPGVQTTNPGYPSITGGGQAWTVTFGAELVL